MKKFKKFFDGEYSVSEDGTGKILVSHLFANALGEGIEEVSEEVIRDASKAIANAAAYISGSDVHMRPTYETETGEFSLSGMLNDYALNFVGGFIGGGLG